MRPLACRVQLVAELRPRADREPPAGGLHGQAQGWDVVVLHHERGDEPHVVQRRGGPTGGLGCHGERGIDVGRAGQQHHVGDDVVAQPGQSSGCQLGPPFRLTGVDRVAGQGAGVTGAKVVVSDRLFHRPQPHPLKLVRRQRALRREAVGGAGSVVGVQGTGDVEVGQRRPDAGAVIGLPIEGADRGSRRTLAEQDLLDIAGQHRVRADLEEHPLAGVDHRSHRVGEPHRLADVRAPVLGVPVRSGDLRGSHRRVQRDDRRPRGQVGQRPGQLRQDRVHQV